MKGTVLFQGIHKMSSNKSNIIVCPHCLAIMKKGFIEVDKDVWLGAWICDCKIDGKRYSFDEKGNKILREQRHQVLERLNIKSRQNAL